MTETPENPPAFPKPPTGDTITNGQPGMTLRDYFAAQFIAPGGHCDGELEHLRAALAYAQADAMLAERTRTDTMEER